jgi:hypothetical protein
MERPERLHHRVTHLPAALFAASAQLGALRHHLVAAVQPLAILRTRLTHGCADLTVWVVIFAHAEKEIGAGCAGLRTIRKQPLVVRSRVLSTAHQAVRHGFHTDCVTVKTVLGAVAHGLAQVAIVRHIVSPILYSMLNLPLNRWQIPSLPPSLEIARLPTL